MKKRQIASDILLWAVVGGVIGLVGYEFAYRRPNEQKQIIRLHFKDANELARGSSVRMMGTEIGYVNDIKIHPDSVDVIVKTFPDSLRIPSGSRFTIEFTGLVGSKSIEIIPPDVPRPTIHGQSQYFVEEPIRLKHTLQYQIDIAQALQRGAENFADSFGKQKPLEELQYNIRAGQKSLIAANNKLAEIQSKLALAQRDVAPGINRASETLSNFAIATRETKQITSPDYLGPYLSGLFHTMNLVLLEGQATIVGIQVEHKVSHFNDRHLVKTAAGMKKLRDSAETFRGGWIVTDLNAGLTQFQEFLTRAQAWFSKNRVLAMKRFRSGVEQFNGKLVEMYVKITGHKPQPDPPPYASKD